MRYKLGFQNGDILEILEMTYKDRKFDIKTIEGSNYHTVQDGKEYLSNKFQFKHLMPF